LGIAPVQGIPQTGARRPSESLREAVVAASLAVSPGPLGVGG
jgi:hypothetical protein